MSLRTSIQRQRMSKGIDVPFLRAHLPLPDGTLIHWNVLTDKFDTYTDGWLNLRVSSDFSARPAKVVSTNSSREGIAYRRDIVAPTSQFVGFVDCQCDSDNNASWGIYGTGPSIWGGSTNRERFGSYFFQKIPISLGVGIYARNLASVDVFNFILANVTEIFADAPSAPLSYAEFTEWLGVSQMDELPEIMTYRHDSPIELVVKHGDLYEIA